MGARPRSDPRTLLAPVLALLLFALLLSSGCSKADDPYVKPSECPAGRSWDRREGRAVIETLETALAAPAPGATGALRAFVQDVLDTYGSSGARRLIAAVDPIRGRRLLGDLDGYEQRYPGIEAFVVDLGIRWRVTERALGDRPVCGA